MEMAKLLQWIVDLGSLKNDSEGREISDKSDFQIYECIGRLLIFIEINVFFIEEITTEIKKFQPSYVKSCRGIDLSRYSNEKLKFYFYCRNRDIAK